MTINMQTSIVDIRNLLDNGENYGLKQLSDTIGWVQNGGTTKWGAKFSKSRALNVFFYMILSEKQIETYIKIRKYKRDKFEDGIAGFLLGIGIDKESRARDLLDWDSFNDNKKEVFERENLYLENVGNKLKEVKFKRKEAEAEEHLNDDQLGAISDVIDYLCKMNGEEEKVKKYADQLKKSKNIIFHGAPGTGKTYLARKIAAFIIDKGEEKNYEDFLDNYENGRIDITGQYEFVQFHPSYDYTDFIEGLRPQKGKDEGSISFELKDGIFKSFIKKAMERESEGVPYIFVIDEINRGEISKILGELFFSIDPGYRGTKGAVLTQYSNMHDDEERLYIPKNVYIIGTMNDIDRSVDSFDFAMRRRFRFIEITADSTIDMLNSLELDENKKNEARARMNALNNKIGNTPELGKNYQIGAAYFMNLADLGENDPFKDLWNDYLEPLLHDYVRGLPNEKEILSDMMEAYNKPAEVVNNKSGQNTESTDETDDGTNESQG